VRWFIVEFIGQQRFGVNLQGRVLERICRATIVPGVLLCVERGFARKEFLVLHDSNKARSATARVYRHIVGGKE
jgi:hypothetical protein